MKNMRVLLTMFLFACSGATDITALLESDIEDCYDGLGPCVIEIAEGDYKITNTIEVCPTVEIKGASDQHTKIETDGSFTAFHVLPYETCQDVGNPWVGLVKLSNFRVTGTHSSSVAYGIHAENKVRVREVRLKNFTQGVRLVANATSTIAKGNANSSLFEDVEVFNTQHAGFYTQGPDVNRTTFARILVAGTVCSSTTTFPSLGECGAVVDKGFLGNMYHAPLVETESTSVKHYVADDLNARHLFLNPYSEGSTNKAIASNPSLILQPTGQWEGNMGYILGNTSYGFQFINDSDPNNVVHFRVGRSATGGVIYEAQANEISTAWPLRLKSELSTDSFRWDVGNLSSAAPWRIKGNNTGTYSIGTYQLKASLLEEI